MTVPSSGGSDRRYGRQSWRNSPGISGRWQVVSASKRVERADMHDGGARRLEECNVTRPTT